MSRARDTEPRLRTASKPFEGVQLLKDKTTKQKSKPAKTKTAASKSKSAPKPRATIKKITLKTKVSQVVQESEDEESVLDVGIQLAQDGTSTPPLWLF
jgi:hypothetical protein